MVAKINRGASTYGAIVYKMEKVIDGDKARIITDNRMGFVTLENFGYRQGA
jgi:hypothetical protein